jgi:hypothetical protein
VGQGVLHLADAVGPQPADFVVPLVNLGGLPAGELRGLTLSLSLSLTLSLSLSI